jgi:hypothetical protein
MSRGTPFQPGNKFGKGRPPGSRNKSTLLKEGPLERLTGQSLPVLVLGCKWSSVARR